MKIFTVQIPESYLRQLENMIPEVGTSRSELIRIATREFLRKELLFMGEIKKVERKIKITRFFDCCINCDKKMYAPSARNHFFHKAIEIFKLKFCCSCYELYKDKSFSEFPEELIGKIRKKIERFKENNPEL
jgi:hypothetical protein